MINLVDVILIIVVLLSAYNGYRRGFIFGLLDLLGWGLVLIAGLRFYQPVAKAFACGLFRVGLSKNRSISHYPRWHKRCACEH